MGTNFRIHKATFGPALSAKRARSRILTRAGAHALIGASGMVIASSAFAGITTTGSIFDNGATYAVGYSGNGTLNIDSASVLSCTWGELGTHLGSTGTATVTDANSSWTSSSTLTVGSFGNGTLTIQNGGQVSSGSGGYIGHISGAGGATTVTGSGSKWSAGTGLYVGDSGRGSLNIQAGGQVTDSSAYIGNASGAIGIATVTGTGSIWNNSSSLDVGESGSGTLNIQAGGQVSNVSGRLGQNLSSVGTATVIGLGSSWINAGQLVVGSNGSGTLTIADGAIVTAPSLLVGANLTNSQINLNVSGSNMIVLGTATTAGNVINQASIKFYADPSLGAGVYTPIAEYAGRTMSWSGSRGTYKATGGTWDSSSHTFTVAPPTSLDSGLVGALSSGQRLVITDASSGASVGASFGPISGNPTLSAAPMTSAELSTLSTLPGFNDQLLGGWDFTTNLTAGSEVLLSFNVGTGYEGNLHLWHLSGGTWSSFTPAWQSYSAQGVLDFPATSFSGYAVTTPVPEPVALSWLGLGIIKIATRRRRR